MKIVKYFIGIYSLLVFIFLLIVYVDMVYVPDPLHRHEQSAVYEVYSIEQDHYNIPKDDIDIVSIELESTNYYPHASRTFKVYYKRKGSEEVRWYSNLRIDNSGQTFRHYHRWWYYYLKNKFNK